MPLRQPLPLHINSKPVWKVHHSVVEWLRQTIWGAMSSTIWIRGLQGMQKEAQMTEDSAFGSAVNWRIWNTGKGPGNKDRQSCFFGEYSHTTWSLTVFNPGTTESHRQLLGGSALCADFPRWKGNSELICGANIKSGILIGRLKNKTTCRLLRPNSNAQICHTVQKRIMKQWGNYYTA